MIVDTSALVAILRAEPDRMIYLNAIVAAEQRFVAAPSHLETSMVLVGSGSPEILDELEAFLNRTSMVVLPFTADHAAVARAAFLRYGKGRHPAALNFGDCIAYAVSKLEAMPLLFKGDVARAA
ncbi:type II toxin-antitoxin system VapC family toxin [Arvimicrobium flavum]|uniref:type II toxin-antitoxin system VapC family toxin n=1 Tax=Arvimicrobium flavum TaxID=3393320 RepID=UPI00237C2C7E|nr:type II toxin-antitoxin system VapC family toxin [Mesorhizobium shangrilense]